MEIQSGSYVVEKVANTVDPRISIFTELIYANRLYSVAQKAILMINNIDMCVFGQNDLFRRAKLHGTWVWTDRWSLITPITGVQC